MRIFLSAGEPSGDMHGANLIRQLKARDPNVQAVGYGGPEMAAAGCELHADLTALAVMWILRVILNIHKFLHLVSMADRYLRHHRPDAVVLIDYPGFNWWIARRAKAHGIPVFYYAPPQIWAWASWRIKKMRRFVDHVLCSLPFEARWFASQGCRSTFVGHPYFDEVRRQQLDHRFLDVERAKPGRLVTLLPGSRTQEVTQNLATMLKAAMLIHAQSPDTRFAIASFKPHQAKIARDMAAKSALPIEVHLRRTPELIHLAECCIAVSGSVSLELLYQAKPTVIVYSVGRFAYCLQAKFRRVKYITLVNLITAKELFPSDLRPYDPTSAEDAAVLFPEYLTCEDRSADLAAHVLRWLGDEAERMRLVERLAQLKAEVGHGGAASRAADYILAHCRPKPAKIRRPHYLPGGRLPEHQQSAKQAA
jgi:lipid-A-disaccharide synthase